MDAGGVVVASRERGEAMNTKKLWITACGAIGIGLVTLVGRAGGQTDTGAYSQMHARCLEAGKEMADLHREIQGIEQRLAKAQKEMNDAKGTDARLSAVIATVNQMADDRTLITQKIIAYNELLAGHELEHMTATGDTAKKLMDDCPVFKTIRGAASHMENTETPKKK
jgi:hypothetical protein